MIYPEPHLFQTHPFPLLDLLLPTFLILLSGLIILRRITSNLPTILLVSISRAAFFFLYFGFFFNGQFTSGYDDYFYIQSGQNIVSSIQNSSFSITSLVDTVGSLHFVYPLLSALSQYLFGEYYYSLCALNVVLTLLCGLVASRAISLATRSHYLATLTGISVILYPDLFLNSTVFAGKDTLVLLLHISLLYVIAYYLTNGRLLLLPALGLLFVLFYTRYYSSIIFFVLIIIIQRRYLSLLICTILFTVLSFSSIGRTIYELSSQGASYVSSLSSNPPYLFFSFFKFILTPRPFFEDSIHKFTLPANIFNWMVFPALLLGFVKCYRSRNPFFRVIALYFTFFCAFYAFADFLNGPRHRLQLTFACVIFIYQGLLSFYHTLRPKTLPHAVTLKHSHPD